MKQIISIQVGQCGNRIGQSFWQSISKQHQINEKGFKQPQSNQKLENINTYYSENGKGYSSRAVFIDLQPGTIDSVLAQKYGSLHRQQNIISGRASTSNNFAKAYYSQGIQYTQYSLDSIRRQAEICQNISAFQITHSIGGGTGSGMTCLLLDTLSDLYSNKIKQSYTVFPSPKVSDNILQYYNSVLSFPYLIPNLDHNFTIHNESLFNICNEKKIIPTYRNLNNIVGDVMAGITCSMRFPCQLNYSPRKISLNMVPFAKMHFFVIGSSTVLNTSGNKNNSVKQFLINLTSPNTYLSKIDPRHGRYFASFMIFRGNVTPFQADKEVFDIQNKHSSFFSSLLSSNISWTICKTPAKGHQFSNAMISNTTVIRQTFSHLRENFSTMYRRRAFLHWYISEGMQQLQFQEAEQSLRDLQFMYQIDSYTDNAVDDNYPDY